MLSSIALNSSNFEMGRWPLMPAHAFAKMCHARGAQSMMYFPKGLSREHLEAIMKAAKFLAQVSAVAAGLAAGILPSAVAQATTVWFGHWALLEVSAACAAGNWDVGTDHARTTIYRPRLTAGDANSAILLRSKGSDVLYTNKNEVANPQMRGNGAFTSEGFNSSALPTGPLDGTFDLTITPATITATTRFLHFIGTFTNWSTITGCTVKIAATYTLRP